MTSWDLNIGKFPSGINKSEPIGEKPIPRIKDKDSGYTMLDADSDKCYEPKLRAAMLRAKVERSFY